MAANRVAIYACDPVSHTMAGQVGVTATWQVSKSMLSVPNS